MCGIAGFVASTQKSPTQDTMKRVLAKIAHRGPDGSGIWQTEDGRVTFGHKRLSIVDLTVAANQPMLRGNQCAIVFNGEIYNHRELRKELETCGIHFNTGHSDTEVLLNGYIHWGLSGLLDKINGMFAFAIFDQAANKVFIARDRIGIKNVYYSHLNGVFTFCSEIKGILASGNVMPAFDDRHLNEYLLNRSLSTPNTLFRHIFKLEAGCFVTIDVNTLSTQNTKYWDPLLQQPDGSIHSQKDVEEALSSLISSSLDYRLEADVPVGMFLSGGVDSNYLLSQLAGKRSGIKCFNASFPSSKGYDESIDARAMADRFGAEIIDVPVHSDNYIEILERVVYFQEEPISAPVCVPVYFLSQSAKEHNVPVVLTGEGSDEVFIGYENWLRIRSTEKALHYIPFSGIASRLAKAIALTVANSLHPIHDILDRAIHGYPLFWGGAVEMNANARQVLLGTEGPASSLNNELFHDKIEPLLQEFKKHRLRSDVSCWMTYMDLTQRLPELMLPRLDRMGMAHSIEGRVPFLDHRIVEYMFRVPEKVMAEQQRVGKPALKSLAQKSLGENFVYRRKKGFRAPVKEWITSGSSEFIRYLEMFSARTGIFKVEGVKLLARHGGRRFFTLVNFMLWYLIFIENVLSDVMPQLKKWDQY